MQVSIERAVFVPAVEQLRQGQPAPSIAGSQGQPLPVEGDGLVGLVGRGETGQPEVSRRVVRLHGKGLLGQGSVIVGQHGHVTGVVGGAGQQVTPDSRAARHVAGLVQQEALVPAGAAAGGRQWLGRGGGLRGAVGCVQQHAAGQLPGAIDGPRGDDQHGQQHQPGHGNDRQRPAVEGIDRALRARGRAAHDQPQDRPQDDAAQRAQGHGIGQAIERVGYQRANQPGGPQPRQGARRARAGQIAARPNAYAQQQQQQQPAEGAEVERRLEIEVVRVFDDRRLGHRRQRVNQPGQQAKRAQAHPPDRMVADAVERLAPDAQARPDDALPRVGPGEDKPFAQRRQHHRRQQQHGHAQADEQRLPAWPRAEE